MNSHANQQFNKNTNIPGFDSYDESFFNPTLRSQYSSYELPFYQTRDTFLDVEVYKRFLDNSISRFRHSVTYSDYKGFLFGLGLDRCQVLGNITSEMADIEMHHNMLTIFDIALIITEHTLNTRGYISTFDLVQLLKEEHKAHHIQLVMLAKTPHQLYHNEDGMFIHPKNCFGDWPSFLASYNTGLTLDIAYKLLFYMKESITSDKSYDAGLLELRNKIMNWRDYNVANYA